MAKQKKQSRFAGKVKQEAHRSQQSGSSYGYLLLPKNVNVFSAPPGNRVRFDILPYMVTAENHPDRDDKLEIAIPGELWYKRPFKVHRNIGASNESFVCPTSIGKRCPICEYRTKRMKEGADKEEVNALKAAQRNLYVLIPIGSKEHEEKPHIWDVSQFLFQNLLNEELQENEDNEVFPDLEEGLTLRVRFDSKTIGSSKPFAEASRIDFEERSEVYDESIMKSIPNLDEVLNILSYAELERHFLELDGEEPGEPIEEDRPEKSTRKPKSTQDDNDDDEKPARRSKRIEPEDDDDEPEPEKPARRKREPEPEEEPEKPARRRREPEPEPDDEPEPEKPARRKPAPASNSKDKCPHNHRFGIDTDQFNECDTCKIWDDCIEQKEKNE